jgi:hypothetical protein
MFFSVLTTRAQTNLFSKYVEKLSFVRTTNVVHLADDLSSLTTLDKIRLKNYRDTVLIESFTSEHGERARRINHLSTPTFFASWMPKPAITIIDQHGASIYNTDGDLIQSMQHSEEYLRLKALSNGERLQEFPVVSSADLSAVSNAGGVVNTMSNGAIKISTATNEFIYDPLNNYLERKAFNPDGSLKFSSARQYTFIPDIGYVITQLVEKRKITLPSGACAEQIEIKTFSNYAIDNGSPPPLPIQQPSSQNELQDFEVFPNPSQDYVQLQRSGNHLDMNTLTIRIYSATGRAVTSNVNFGERRIYITDLPSGLYFVKIVDEKGQDYIVNFIKN